MGDVGDDFRASRKYQKEKKASNLNYSVNKLDELGVNYKTRNYVHYIVEHHGKVIDFYPSTGLWWDRKNRNQQRRGIKSLLRYLGFDIQKPQIEVEKIDIPF